MNRNLATAITLDPMFLSKVNQLVIMGGTLYAQGNANRAAEFNFHSDPEAAHIVFDSALEHSPVDVKGEPKIKLVTWETCLDHKLTWDFYDSLISSKNPLSRVLRGITKLAESLLRDKTVPPEDALHHPDRYMYHMHQFLLPDVYAALVLLDETSVLRKKDWDIAIELEGKHARGGCFVEWLPLASKACNATVIMAIKEIHLEDLLKKTFL
jgi:inosine-uridine nucleoside N-ribohydrolase